MNQSKSTFIALIIAGAVSTASFAEESQQSVQLDISSQQRVVVSIQIDDMLLQGNKQFGGHMGSLPVDGLVPRETGNGSGCQGGQCPAENEGGTGTPHYLLLPEWGEVTVALHCNSATVALYTEIDQNLELILEETVTTNYCAQ